MTKVDGEIEASTVCAADFSIQTLHLFVKSSDIKAEYILKWKGYFIPSYCTANTDAIGARLYIYIYLGKYYKPIQKVQSIILVYLSTVVT